VRSRRPTTHRPWRARRFEGLSEVFRAQTTESIQLIALILRSKRQSKPLPRRWKPAPRRLGVEKNYVRGGEFLRLSNVILGRHADRLDRRQAEARLHGLDPGWRFRAVELQIVGRQRLDDCIQRVVVGVDRQRHFLDPARRERAKASRRVEVDMTRAFFMEHEARHIGAGANRGLQRRSRRQAADLTITRGTRFPKAASAPVIGVLETDDVVLAQIGTRLHLDQFEVDLAGLLSRCLQPIGR